MANEIQVTTRLYASKGGAVIPGATHSWTATMGTGRDDMACQTQSIGSGAEESLSVGADVTAPYGFELVNNDATNYCKIGFAAGVYVGRIPPGQSLIWPYLETGVTVYLRADTAAVQLQTATVEV